MSRDYKPTCLLPDSDFPMKADLAKREPNWLARWKRDDVYGRILARPTTSKFVFHDGPPYANGHMHYGHVLNNALKDFVTRFHNAVGEHTRFVPGWDCHGLPIELNVDRALGAKKREMSATQVREACRAEAAKWLDVQREERVRIGVLGTWDTPYLTMDPAFEGRVVEALAAFVARGLVYRGKKPVQWCATHRTALAESEVEYIEGHVSPSVYVKFAATPEADTQLRARFPHVRAERVCALVWTTTPWTLPANLAIAARPDEDYVLVEVERSEGREAWLVARALVESVMRACGADGAVHVAAVEGTSTGESLAGLRFRHPWEDRDSPLVTARYVETDTGTGLVHTAPGHGRDDYNTGLAHKLEAYAPLDDAARYTDELGAGSKALGLEGKSVWEANPILVAHMAATGILANKPGDRITHKYPGCWRCHNPLVTRATTQWFIALDQPMTNDAADRTLRGAALEEIDRLAREGSIAAGEGGAAGWVPAWGRERIQGMIANRPDWCISRQRVWGVPIPALHCTSCGHATLSTGLLAHVAKLFAERGAGAWYDDAVDVVPPGFSCEKCGAAGPFERDRNIVDVWFESGSSFHAVCEGPSDLGVPVDLYLEGSDQHRGWFHSSLLVGIAMHGRAPFRTVLTHGFVVDENGRALSKSTINEMKARGQDVSHLDPLLTIKQQGAEVLRAWAAYEDYRGDVRLSKEHFAQVAEAYRKIRNTFRFMLQVMRRTPAPALADVTLEPIDRWALAWLADVVTASETAYRAYEFRAVFTGAVKFAGELSSQYLDVIKDWLYNDEEESPRRRSTLAVVDTIVRAMAVVLGPILPFTSEDVWDHLPRRADDATSVHLAPWPVVARPADGDALVAAAAAVRNVREAANAVVEPIVQRWGSARQDAKKGGDAADERVPEHARIDHVRDVRMRVTLPPDVANAIAPLAGSLADMLLVGSLEVAEGSMAAEVTRGGAACERCWRRKPDVEQDGLCVRCRRAVATYDHAHGGELR